MLVLVLEGEASVTRAGAGVSRSAVAEEVVCSAGGGGSGKWCES